MKISQQQIDKIIELYFKDWRSIRSIAKTEKHGRATIRHYIDAHEQKIIKECFDNRPMPTVTVYEMWFMWVVIILILVLGFSLYWLYSLINY